MKKWIKFGEPRASDSGKTQIWEVSNYAESVLGEVRWLGRWRKYGFCPRGFTFYDEYCLRQIADFCEHQSRELRKKWKTT